MSDTPRTDAIAKRYDANEIGAAEVLIHAGELERDNARLQMQIDHLKEANKRIADIYSNALDCVMTETDRKDGQLSTQGKQCIVSVIALILSLAVMLIQIWSNKPRCATATVRSVVPPTAVISRTVHQP